MLNKISRKWLVLPFVFVCCGLLYWEYLGVESKVSCYAETPRGTIRLDGVCILRSSDIGWQYREDYTLVLFPVDTLVGDEGFFFYYLSDSQSGPSVNWNFSSNNSHAQAYIDSDFLVKDRVGRGRCWESDKAVVCFD